MPPRILRTGARAPRACSAGSSCSGSSLGTGRGFLLRSHAPLADAEETFAAYLAPLREAKCIIYGERPFE